MRIELYSELIRDFCRIDGISNPVQLFINGMQEELDELEEAVNYEEAASKEEIESELGDILWYLVTVANLYEISMSSIMSSNLNKLERRNLSRRIPNVLRKEQ